MAKNYTTQTASLKATLADVRNIDAKKITLNGKPIVGEVYDIRGDKATENDIWPNGVQVDANGNVTVYPLGYNKVEVGNWNDIHKVIRNINPKSLIDNVAYDSEGNIVLFADTKAWTCGLVDEGGGRKVNSTFYYAEIENFSSDLSSLTNGDSMFGNCQNLTSFSSDLSSLTYATYMFSHCYNLTTFSTNLPSLENGSWMFYYCTNLESFSSDISSLTDAVSMFYCAGLESFSSDLSSLTDGQSMFSWCKLDAPSVANIVHTLPTHETDGRIDIGIGCDDTEADKLLFAQECDCETWQELLDDFSAKNWTVYFQCEGRPTTTYNMRRGETLPIYTKLVEVIMPTDENERKPRYAYTSADGSKFYNINYFHSTNGSTEGYDVFSSLEEAISTYNVTPKN